MLDISIIIFFAALLGIAGMFIAQKKKIERGQVETEFVSKDLSYENFKMLNAKVKRLWLEFAHTTAIILSKLWAHFTHHITAWFHKGVKRVEEQLIKHEKKAASGEVVGQSVFITTIKTYKKEIKKLKGTVEEELPRPRETQVDFTPTESNIEKPSQEETPE